MAIFKQVWNITLGESAGQPGESAELSVVREDRKPEILISVVESRPGVRRRMTFSITGSQAMSLARFLAGIRPLDPAAGDDDDETTPTAPGKRGRAR